MNIFKIGVNTLQYCYDNKTVKDFFKFFGVFLMISHVKNSPGFIKNSLVTDKACQKQRANSIGVLISIDSLLK